MIIVAAAAFLLLFAFGTKETYQNAMDRVEYAEKMTRSIHIPFQLPLLAYYD
jgi:hypothetical protein